MSRTRMIVTGGLIVAALAVLLVSTRGFGLWRDDGASLSLYGNVDIRSVDLGFRVGGRIARMPVEEGAHVMGGQLLAALDRRPLDDRVAQAKAQVALADAGLARALHGNRPQDIAQARDELARQQASLVNAQQDYDRRRALVASGAVSRSEFDRATAALNAARAQVSAAGQALSLQKAGARAEDVDAARAQLENAQAQLAGAQTDIADSTIRAPDAGTILTRAREPGAIVQPGETVFTLTIDRPMRVRAYVAEPDLGRISPGMAVLVRADGNPRTYHGSIGYISPAAEFTPKSVETENLRADLVYRLRVIVSDPDDGLRQGQPVTVEVPGARAPRK